MILFVLAFSLLGWIVFMVVLTLRESKRPLYVSLSSPSVDAKVDEIKERVLETIEKMKKLEVKA